MVLHFSGFAYSMSELDKLDSTVSVLCKDAAGRVCEHKANKDTKAI